MAFPCPICGGVSTTRTSRMVGTSTKEHYYSCNNLDCLYQFKTFEGDPVTLAMPVNAARLSCLPRLSTRKFGKHAPAPDVAAAADAITTASETSAKPNSPLTGDDAAHALAVAEEARSRPAQRGGEYMPVLIKEPGRTLHLLAGNKAQAEARARA